MSCLSLLFGILLYEGRGGCFLTAVFVLHHAVCSRSTTCNTVRTTAVQEVHKIRQFIVNAAVRDTARDTRGRAVLPFPHCCSTRVTTLLLRTCGGDMAAETHGRFGGLTRLLCRSCRRSPQANMGGVVDSSHMVDILCGGVAETCLL